MKEVLGIKSIPQSLLHPEPSEKHTASSLELFFTSRDQVQYKKIPLKSEKVVFISFIEGVESLFDVGTYQLFEKMVSAMGLQSSDYLALEMNKSDEAERFLFQQMLEVEGACFVLFKGSPDRQGLLKISGRKYLQTYSPIKVVLNAGLKKPVWDDLQIVMRDVSSEKDPN